MSSSLVNVYIPANGLGFSFKNNSIITDKKVIGYGADVVIYITDQNTVAVPTGSTFPNLAGLYNDQLYTPSALQGPTVNGSTTIIGFGDPMEHGLYTRNQYSLQDVLGPIPESNKACDTLIPDDVIADYKANEYKSQFAATCGSRSGCTLVNTPSGGAPYSCGRTPAVAPSSTKKNSNTVVIVVVVVVAVLVVIVVVAITIVAVMHIRSKGYKKYEEGQAKTDTKNQYNSGNVPVANNNASKTSPAEEELEEEEEQ